MDVVIASLPEYWQGFSATLFLLLCSGMGALALGILIAAMRISPVASLRLFATGYTELFRNIPLTLLLFFCAYVLPYLGAASAYEWLAILGLTLYTSPFVAEAIRSGINGVPIGQAEAARSIGLGFRQTLTLVVLPQAIRMVIPPLINVYIALTKNTSVAGGFFVVELFAVGGQLANAHGNAVVPVLLGVATFYLVITIPLGQIANVVEAKVRVIR